MFDKIKSKLKNLFAKNEEVIEETEEITTEVEETPQEITTTIVEKKEKIVKTEKERKIPIEKSQKKEKPKKIEIKEEIEEIKSEELIEENTLEDKDTEKIELEKEPEEEKKGFFSKIFSKKKEEVENKEIEEIETEMLKDVSEEEIIAIKEKTKIEEQEILKNKSKLEEKIKKEDILEKKEYETIEKPQEEKKGFFAKTFDKLKSKEIDESDFEKIWSELQLFLLEINVAYDIVETIENKLRAELIGNSFDRFSLSKKIREVLEKEVENVLKTREANFLEKLKELKKTDELIKILILGVNGTGKTTSIAKIINYLQKKDFKVVVAAADTFRAAAVEQLEEHSKKLGFKLIQHKGGSDPAAVAFDAIEHAKAKKLDIVLIDTAGRMPNNTNLMNELQKIKRVSNAQLTIFIGDSISGNDLIEQIELFNKAINIDGIILTKVDTDEKPGSIVTTAYTIAKPIYFLGIGQTYDDLIEFDAKLIARKLFEIDDE